MGLRSREDPSVCCGGLGQGSGAAGGWLRGVRAHSLGHGAPFCAPRGVLGFLPTSLPCTLSRERDPHPECAFPPLQGTAYYVQVSAYNMKGWGPPQASVPPFAIPSSKYS